MKPFLGFGIAALAVFSLLSVDVAKFGGWEIQYAESQMAGRILADNLHRMR